MTEDRSDLIIGNKYNIFNKKGKLTNDNREKNIVYIIGTYVGSDNKNYNFTNLIYVYDDKTEEKDNYTDETTFPKNIVKLIPYVSNENIQQTLLGKRTKNDDNYSLEALDGGKRKSGRIKRKTKKYKKVKRKTRKYNK